jgi:Ca-activated chloride channel family protein
MIRFSQSYLLLLIPIILWIIFKKRKSSPLKFSSIEGLGKTQSKLSYRHHMGKYLIALSMIFFVFALARPQTQDNENPMTDQGIDMVLLLDVSGSMASVDFEPNRLEVARSTIETFIKERVHDRLSLVVFGGSAYTKIPLTMDKNVLKESLDSVSIDSVNEEGTAIGMALSVGVNRLKKSEASSKVMILVTDGDNNAGSISPETASELAETFGIKIFTIGVGTDKTILPYTIFGKTSYQQVEGGLNEELLQSIADTSGGKYFRAKDIKTLESVFDEINQLVKTDFDYKDYNNYKEWGFLMMAIGLVLLAIGIILDKYVFIRIP